MDKMLNNNRNFDKDRCLGNIRFLLKENNSIKIGQIEKEAGVSPGYMSRIEKADNNAAPSIEFVVTAAKLLGTSLDILVLSDMKKLTPTERYMMTFIEKLRKETQEGHLEWKCELADTLNYSQLNPDVDFSHPLFSEETFFEEAEEGYPNLVTRVIFPSKVFGYNTAIKGNCFSLKMKEEATLYLMNISKTVYSRDDKDTFAKELWLVRPLEEKHFLISNKGNLLINELLESLYEEVEENSVNPHIKKEVKGILDAFINNHN